MAATILESEGLWLSLRRRLLRAWEGVWGQEAVERIARSVFARLADLDDTDALPEEASPAECLGVQAYIALCRAPGDGARARERLYPPE